ncbi:MAG: C4-dicarboxylate transporter DctA [Alphaproteobacteria bacterium]|nr:C4-dicarboxylate transporter DctA [Alphaproteobacteria bacterium]
MSAPAKPKKPFYRSLFFQVIAAIILGVIVGIVSPENGVAMKPLGDGFIKLIKMLIAPIIFCTIVSGVAGMGDMKKVGRVGAKALIYFEIITTIALVMGLVVVDVIKPGSGMNINVSAMDIGHIKEKVAATSMASTTDFLMHIIPSTLVSAFADGEILQVLLIALLFAWAIGALGEKGKPALDIINSISHVMFKMVDYITLLAPVGAFGAMAYTIGKFGLGSLKDLGLLVLLFYGTGVVFVFGILGPIMSFYCKLSTWQLIKYIREELFIVLGTSSSETVLPRMMERLTAMGCSKPVVGLVVPSGYSFNLDGSSLYFTMGAMFICYATGTDITVWHQLTLLGVLLLTSKGAAGVTGSAFLVLAATLSSMNFIPPENLAVGLALIFAIDRFMSTGRAIINIIGNAVATIVVAKWERQLDHKLASDVLAGRREPDLTLIDA